MAYTTIPKSTAQFNTKLYTGNNGASLTISGLNFQPDLTWIKARNATETHGLYDIIRGALYRLQSNSSNASTSTAGTVTGWTSDGFSLGTSDEVNGTYNYASWNWKANGSGSANTDGTINSTATSANTTSGFSIVTYTGTGANATVGHGLGVAPKMILVKQTNTTKDWMIYNKFTVSNGTGSQYYLHLNSSDAKALNATMWQNTDPTSSVFSIGTSSNVNASGGTYIAYCFADVQGFSKMGYYLGNGHANGTFAYTGFKPAFILVKNTGSARNWQIYDSKRIGYNYNNYRLPPNTAGSEESNLNIDIYSNGFKTLATDADVNENDKTYIFLAFAEEPLVSTNGQPATAR